MTGFHRNGKCTTEEKLEFIEIQVADVGDTTEWIKQKLKDVF